MFTNLTAAGFLVSPGILPGLLALAAFDGLALFVWYRWAPRLAALRRPWAAALGAALPASLLIVAGVVYGAEVTQTYGCSLFIALPIVLGLVATLLVASAGPVIWDDAAWAASLATFFSSLLLIMMGLEGVICIVLALPLALPLALLGAGLAYAIQQSFWRRRNAPLLLALLLASSPLMMGAEATLDREPPVFAVSTTVLVDAPPEAVWPHVLAVPELPPPREILFRLGIAYPIAADLHGRGVGAVRTCRFSTGPLVEPITVWDEPRLLRFRVVASPPSMEELSPYPDLHPPHVEGFLVGEQGEFRLEPLPGGRTRLTGTSWYRHGMWPAAYWRLWSDLIVHQVHRRVLTHVAARAEGEARGLRPVREGSISASPARSSGTETAP